MKRIFAIGVLAISGSGTAAPAQPPTGDPPAMGVCQPLESDNVGAITKVNWTYDAASDRGTAKVLANYGDEYDGVVVGMRPHIDWVKFSINFTDRFDKLNELTIFHAVGDYRMGVVSFDLVEGKNTSPRSTRSRRHNASFSSFQALGLSRSDAVSIKA